MDILLSDDALSMSVALLLVFVVAALRVCVCGDALDPSGSHALIALSCRRVASRHGRHSQVNLCLKKALAEAGVASIMEPSELTLSEGRGPTQ